MLATALTSASDPLAYPQAALFGFAVAVGTDHVLATAPAARAKVQGADPLAREFSAYYRAAARAALAAGRAVAWPAQDWQVFPTLPLTAFVAFRRTRAHHVRLARFRKHPQGPKKPQPKRSYDPQHPHVAPARLIAARK